MVRPEVGGRNAYLVTFLQGGGLVFRHESNAPAPEGVEDLLMELTRHSDEGRLEAHLGTYPHWRLVLVSRGLMSPPLFEAQSSAAGAPDGFWVGTGRSCELLRHDAAGSVVRVVRWPCPDRRIDPRVVEIVKADRVAAASDAQRALVAQTEQARPVAEQFPAYEQVMSTGNGQPRVKLYQRPGHEGPTTWVAFDAEGRLLGRIELPPAFRPFEWGTDYVVGVHRDELGVERVHLYDLAGP
jgi:hypothetical protein